MTSTFPSVSGTTRVFGCIASPVDHVRAPTVFNALFAERGLDHVMVPINAPADDLQVVIEGTAPHAEFWWHGSDNSAQGDASGAV
jgi:shikimate dehydrogenase